MMHLRFYASKFLNFKWTAFKLLGNLLLKSLIACEEIGSRSASRFVWAIGVVRCVSTGVFVFEEQTVCATHQTKIAKSDVLKVEVL